MLQYEFQKENSINKVFIHGVRSPRKREMHKAFTLIELLVVIAILSILTSLLLPALKKAREQGKKILCANNEKQIGTGFLMYADNYNGYFPSENTSGTAGIDKGWADNVAPYIGMEGKYNASYRPRYGANSILSCPSLQNNNSYSDYLLCQLFWAYWNGGSNPWAAYNNIKKMKAPSSKGILVDSEFYSFFNYTTAKIGIKGVMISAARLRLLHLNGFNILYCDGHSTWQAGEIGDDLQDIFDASK